MVQRGGHRRNDEGLRSTRDLGEDRNYSTGHEREEATPFIQTKVVTVSSMIHVDLVILPTPPGGLHVVDATVCFS